MATTVSKKRITSWTNPQHWNFPISDLPKDILIRILCSLPTKAIVCCKQVCREWLNIILDPQFAEAHYNYITTTTTTSSRLSLVTYRHRSFCSPVQDSSIYLIEGNNYPHDYELMSSKLIHNVGSLNNNKLKSVEVMNSCRGFLLLTAIIFVRSQFGSDFHVYNPLTKQYFKVPPVMVNKLGDMQAFMFGLGFGLITKQYKVARLTVVGKGVHDFGVVTIGTDHVWRSVETNKVSSDLHDKQLFSACGGPFDLNGVLHWAVKVAKQQKLTDQVITGQENILCFNVDKEEFSAMRSPCSKNTSKVIVTIGNVNGLLCLGIMERGKSPPEMELWVMREYGVTESWAIYAVLKNDIIRCPSLVKVCGNGEIVLWAEDNYPRQFYMFSYNQKEGRSTRLRINGFDETIQEAAAIYVPSFFSIGSQVHAKYELGSTTG